MSLAVPDRSERPGRLEVLQEPIDWRAAWRRAQREGTDGGDPVQAVTDRAWAMWASTLARAGVDAPWLAGVVAGYRRELLLWLAGERLWEQLEPGLAGRVARRAPLRGWPTRVADASRGPCPEPGPPGLRPQTGPEEDGRAAAGGDAWATAAKGNCD